jgi:hypothetical protein
VAATAHVEDRTRMTRVGIGIGWDFTGCAGTQRRQF